jgi:calcium/calmodulin-dependent protein kinase I
MGEDILGKGAFSVVKTAHRLSDECIVAVKIVHKAGIKESQWATLKREVDVLRKFDHARVLRCIDFFEERDLFFIVMEYVEGGDLCTRISEKKCYSEKDARVLIMNILSAIEAIHAKGVVHRYVHT